MIQRTGVRFNTGSGLRAIDLNAMNDKINELVGIVNTLMQDRVNIHLEVVGLDSPGITLSKAIELVPKWRRVQGVTVKFRNTSEEWVTYVFTGDDWEKERCWSKLPYDTDILDGGLLNG